MKGKQKLIEMLKWRIAHAKDVEITSFPIFVSEATDILRELERDEWISVDDRLPDVVITKEGVIENKDLVVIFNERYGSYEFAILTRANGALVWNMPDHGYAEMSDVKIWSDSLPQPPKTDS